MTIIPTKKTLRISGRAFRAALSSAAREAADRQIERSLLNSPLFDRNDMVIGYRNQGTEVSVDEFLRAMLAAGRSVLLPRVRPERQLELCLVRDLEKDCSPGAYGILEPVTPGVTALPASGIILAPGAAFDRSGGRIGSGMGFYDRLLQRLGTSFLRIGICYECQIIDQVPLDPWDEKMNWLVTEKEFALVNRRGA